MSVVFLPVMTVARFVMMIVVTLMSFVWLSKPPMSCPWSVPGRSRGITTAWGASSHPWIMLAPENLRITPLIKRVEANPGVEVILALGADVEGEATTNYLAEVLSYTRLPGDQDCPGHFRRWWPRSR